MVNLIDWLIKRYRRQLLEDYDFYKAQSHQFQKTIQELRELVPHKYEKADYWNNRWEKNNVTYKAQGFEMDIRNLILNKSYILEQLIPGTVLKIPTTDDDKALVVLKYVQDNMKYTSDKTVKKVTEFWQHPEETIRTLTGDCFAGYEKIYTKKGLKQIKDINIGDEVLSYDFNYKQFVYKKVIKHWYKGKLKVNRILFRNGQTLDVSEKHPMWHRINQQGLSKYKKQYLCDIDLTRWWKRKIPCIKKLPYTKIEPPHNKEIYRVIGHFIAEGWHSKDGKVGSSGYELKYIYSILDKNNIPYSKGMNGNGVPTINFLKSNFKEELKKIKTNSFDIKLPESHHNLPEEFLEELLYGMWLGDGTKKQYPDKRGFRNNKKWTYSTSSEELAKSIQRIFLHLGKPVHVWKQLNHKGVGNKPIWRINYNSNSHFGKFHGYNGLSEVGIKGIEYLNKVDMWDLTVEDTNTVILENGIISHQCEDGALLIISLLRIMGVPAYKLKLCTGYVRFGEKRIGHAYVLYLADDDKWYVLDWCYWPRTSIGAFKKTPHNELLEYEDVWWTANDQFTWSKHNIDADEEVDINE